jgi:hypothetical protein
VDNLVIIGFEANTVLFLLDLLFNFTCVENNLVACLEYEERFLDLLKAAEDVRTSCRSMLKLVKETKKISELLPTTMEGNTNSNYASNVFINNESYFDG